MPVRTSALISFCGIVSRCLIVHRQSELAKSNDDDRLHPGEDLETDLWLFILQTLWRESFVYQHNL